MANTNPKTGHPDVPVRFDIDQTDDAETIKIQGRIAAKTGRKVNLAYLRRSVYKQGVKNFNIEAISL